MKKHDTVQRKQLGNISLDDASQLSRTSLSHMNLQTKVIGEMKKLNHDKVDQNDISSDSESDE